MTYFYCNLYNRFLVDDRCLIEVNDRKCEYLPYHHRHIVQSLNSPKSTMNAFLIKYGLFKKVQI
jgi:hypothetical protein